MSCQTNRIDTAESVNPHTNTLEKKKKRTKTLTKLHFIYTSMHDCQPAAASLSAE